MKKVIRLTENDLSRIVKRVLNEGKKSVDKWALYSTYKKYNDLGSGGTFKEIFLPEIKKVKNHL